MRLKLNVYTNDEFTEVKRTCEAERLRVPYRVAMYVAQSLDEVEDITDERQILKLLAGSGEQVTKIIKATFGVSETELEAVDAGEMIDVALELYRYAIEKFGSLIGGNGPNGEAGAAVGN
ncbi:MAG: hypothetical protein NC548_26900 [Lachnospiraceae bacterium]|nr:hypothetical protein [Lachnospiraceae bacterium]